MGGLRTRVMFAAGCALALAGGAFAQDATLDLSPPSLELRGFTEEAAAPETAITLSTRNAFPRFAWEAPIEAVTGEAMARRVELELAAGGGDAPLDIALAQRASLGGDEQSTFDRRSHGSELRVGQGLVERREATDARAVYAFLASDDEALTWQPGARSAFEGQGQALALQNQVQVGDLSAGVTYERNGVQASLAYVEREESTRVGAQSFSQDESFAGLTVTMRN